MLPLVTEFSLILPEFSRFLKILGGCNTPPVVTPLTTCTTASKFGVLVWLSDKYSDWSFHTTTLSFIVCMQHSSVCFETLDNLRTINRSKRHHLLPCSLTSALFSSFIFCSFLHSRPHIHREEWYVFLYIARLCLYLHTGSDLIHMQHNRCCTQYIHIRSTKYWSHN